MTSSFSPGWSTDRHQVALNRLLWGMFAADSGGGTYAPEPYAVAAQLGLLEVLDPILETNRLDLFNADDTFDGRTWSPQGREIATEFRRHSPGAFTRRPLARRAILNFLGHRGAHAGRDIQLDTILTEPDNWCYGTPFSEDELRDAARNLYDRGYVTINGSDAAGQRPGNPYEQSISGEVILPIQMTHLALTAQGEKCVERYSSNPDEMETQTVSTGDNFTFGSVTSTGNASFGGSNITQNAVFTVTAQQAAGDLAAILDAARGLDGFPESEVTEADQVHQELKAATPENASQVIGQAHGFFRRLAKIGQPAVASLMTAAGNYAAVRFGISS